MLTDIVQEVGADPSVVPDMVDFGLKMMRGQPLSTANWATMVSPAMLRITRRLYDRSDQRAWSEELEELAGLGFVDRERNLAALRQTKGDVFRAIDLLAPHE
jgi:hypothetical protein